MSERMTSIRLRGVPGAGLAEWGRKSPQDMVRIFRHYAQQQRDMYDAILAAADDDYRVETYTGVHAQRNKEVLQEGLPSPILSQQEKAA